MDVLRPFVAHGVLTELIYEYLLPAEMAVPYGRALPALLTELLSLGNGRFALSEQEAQRLVDRYNKICGLFKKCCRELTKPVAYVFDENGDVCFEATALHVQALLVSGLPQAADVGELRPLYVPQNYGFYDLDIRRIRENNPRLYSMPGLAWIEMVRHFVGAKTRVQRRVNEATADVLNARDKKAIAAFLAGSVVGAHQSV